MKFLVILPLVLITILFSNVYAQTQTDLDNGRSAMRNGDYEEAINYFEKVLEDDPNNVIAITNIGGAKLKQGQIDDGIFYLQNALEIDPSNLIALNNLGTAFALLNEIEQAKEYFEKASEIDPTYETSKKNLANLSTKSKWEKNKATMEIIVRNPEGMLIAYMQTNDVRVMDNWYVHQLIDSWDSKGFVFKNGTKFVIRNLHIDYDVSKNDALGLYGLGTRNNPDKQFVQSYHYQTPVNVGDTIMLNINVYRPVE